MSRGLRVARSLTRTVAQAVPTILGIIVLNFFLLKLAPGDAADAMAAQDGSATAESMIALRQRFGLDNPVLVQLLSYLNNLAHFSLGNSPRWGVSVVELIGQRLPGTLSLMAVALVIAIVIGLALGAVIFWTTAVWSSCGSISNGKGCPSFLCPLGYVKSISTSLN